MSIGDRFADPQEGGAFQSQTASESTDLAATVMQGSSSKHERATSHAAPLVSKDLVAEFTKFCEENTARLLSVAYRITRNPWDARDALQNVFERFWTRWHEEGFRCRVTNSRSYSNSCVANSAIDIIRSEKSRTQREEKDARKEVGKGDDYLHVEEDDSLQRALNALHSLNQNWRLVIHLRYVEDYKIAEVAALLRISESTARRYEKRAMEALEEAYKRS